MPKDHGKSKYLLLKMVGKYQDPMEAMGRVADMKKKRFVLVSVW